MSNVRLITTGAQQFSVTAIKAISLRKANLPEKRDNDTITRKTHADGNNWGYIPISLGSRLISVGRQ